MKGLRLAVLGERGITLGRSSVVVPHLRGFVGIYFGCNYGYVLAAALYGDGLALFRLIGPAGLLTFWICLLDGDCAIRIDRDLVCQGRLSGKLRFFRVEFPGSRPGAGRSVLGVNVKRDGQQ